MPKGEHWARWREAQPPIFCIECGNVIEWRKARHDRGDGRSADWHRPDKYCSLKCTGLAASKLAASKAEGTFVDKHGYLIHSGRGSGKKYQQPVHRRVMEKSLGRKLEKWETVHHRDGNRQNNSPGNLELWASRHGRGQRVIDLQPLDPGATLGLLGFGA